MDSTSTHVDMEHREESMTANLIVFVLLLVLLVLTYVAYQIPMGRWNLIVALIIAVIKGSMVLMVFMHVRLSPRLVWIFATAAFLWLALMIGGTMNDYITRKPNWDSLDSHRLLSPEAAAMQRAE
jgi:cytochrome c oxidase subunit IV